MASRKYQQVLSEAERLPGEEQLALIARLTERLKARRTSSGKGLRWEDYAGSAPYPLCGEDAQAWVTRTREECDKGRKAS